MPDETMRSRRRPRRSDPETGDRGRGGEQGGTSSPRRRPRQRGSEAEAEREPEGRPRRRPRGRQPSGQQVALRARDTVAEMTGLSAESVSGLQRTRDGTWKVTVEVLEVERVPDTDDVLGSYEAEVDEDGELLSYARVARYPRSRPSLAQGPRGG